MEYQKKGGNGGINDQGRLDTVLLNAKTTQPHPLSVPFDFHGRYDSYIHLKSDRLLGTFVIIHATKVLPHDVLGPALTGFLVA